MVQILYKLDFINTVINKSNTYRLFINQYKPLIFINLPQDTENTILWDTANFIVLSIGILF